jgi:hypothetical protein
LGPPGSESVIQGCGSKDPDPKEIVMNPQPKGSLFLKSLEQMKLQVEVRFGYYAFGQEVKKSVT